MTDRDANRAAMPETAEKLDELRAVFGKPAWFRVEEAGRVVEWGKRTVNGTAYPIVIEQKRG